MFCFVLVTNCKTLNTSILLDNVENSYTRIVDGTIAHLKRFFFSHMKKKVSTSSVIKAIDS